MELPDLTGASVVGICHPDWRGVRTAAQTFRVPVIQSDDLERDAAEIVATLADVRMLIVHGMPPGTRSLLEGATAAGIRTGAIHYSSPAQHGAGAAEWDQVTNLLSMLDAGVLQRLGFAKAGIAEVIESQGRRASFVPARPPLIKPVQPLDLGPGSHIGVFGEVFWRKNIATQLGAAALLENSVSHVLTEIPVPYLQSINHRVHGVLPWEEFMAVLGSVDLNLYVSLAECLPLTPMESYRLGVPCLTSQTSVLFKSDPDLWEATTVGELDNPSAIAAAAKNLLASSEEVVAAANRWLDHWDSEAGGIWDEFVSD